MTSLDATTTTEEPAAADPRPLPDSGRPVALKVLVVLGHPRADSFCAALAAAYADGARRAGAEVRELRVADLAFAPDVTAAAISAQPLEPDIRRAQDLIAWADHLAFVYPNWWGTMPARLKAFLDRTLTPGFAFAEREGKGAGFEPLLRGKTADLLTTMDTPRWVYRWILKAPGHNAMRRAVLGFCGVETARTEGFALVKDSTPAERGTWLAAAGRAGSRLARGPLSARQRAQRKLAAWLAAIRLQFYPMTWLAYTVGALAAAATGATESLHAAPFWWGLAALFFLEVATVLANDLFDFETDRRNRNYGPFTGGSRVLVDGRLTFREVRRGIAVALALAALAAAVLLAATPAPLPAAAVLLAMAALALGYTVPPLKLSYRGLGELDVGLTHGVGAVLCGFAFQGGPWHSPVPWLLGLPLTLAVLPGIILAGIPDRDADREAAKGTVAVRTGVRGAYLAAAALTALAALSILALQPAALRDAFAPYLVLPHAALLLVVLARRLKAEAAATRIDGPMAVALAYTVWFAAVPLARLV